MSAGFGIELSSGPDTNYFSHYATTNSVNYIRHLESSADVTRTGGTGYAANRRTAMASAPASIYADAPVSATSKYPLLDASIKDDWSKSLYKSSFTEPVEQSGTEMDTTRFPSGYTANRKGYRVPEEPEEERTLHPSVKARIRRQDPVQAENDCAGPERNSTTTKMSYGDKSSTFRSYSESTYRSMKTTIPSPTRALTGYSANRSFPDGTNRFPDELDAFTTTYRESHGRAKTAPDIHLKENVLEDEEDLPVERDRISGFARTIHTSSMPVGTDAPTLQEEAMLMSRLTPLELSRFRRAFPIDYDTLTKVDVLEAKNTTYQAAHNELSSKLHGVRAPTAAEMKAATETGKKYPKSKSSGYSGNRTMDRLPPEIASQVEDPRELYPWEAEHAISTKRLEYEDPRIRSSFYRTDYKDVSSDPVWTGNDPSPSKFQNGFTRRFGPGSPSKTTGPATEEPAMATHPDLHEYDSLHPSVRKRMEKLYPYEFSDRHEHKRKE